VAIFADSNSWRGDCQSEDEAARSSIVHVEGQSVEKQPNKKRRGRQRELNEILRRIDQLPVLDSRSPDQIVGYDEIGVPATDTYSESGSSPQDQAGPAESFDFEAWKNRILNNPVSRAAVEDFLKHRHRDWEQ
jgi:hypothetical protein